ncbi:23S rRNA (cytidine2498-2'-O)-methyltransferase [Paenibacillus sp. UNCCL117]|uniref:SAM-dependent methyltransferase n=1 Tax=unclassified Paenibacillus TaxID=185978 RepID=UPI000888A13C|nr:MULTISPECIES: SAM-dependent methyltransferase [unclassified Paenibacillus]SDC47503.1 23S rRNA (cytidine2498-2'-O)-methyltransferase [Paenibacillus sp. cl123]SFW12116.1 23S rRNA (cytidine2498-2'-O)-methyltransferase [Paenibacillus sp. UNCCL117]
MSGAVFVGTSNRGFAQQAQEELKRLLGPSVRFGWLSPGETFRIQSPLGREETIAAVLEQEPAFLRHMFPADAEREWSGTAEEAVGAVCELIGEKRSALKDRTTIAVQIRRPEAEQDIASPAALKAELDVLLEQEYGMQAVVRQSDWILSVYMTRGSLYVGLTKPEQNLSDWPGGAIRFRKEEGQVSRAKFKLLEAEQAFGLDFHSYREALDIGAAPGGWTSLLLERGLDVTAVDPAKLDPALLRHPRLTYLAKKADEVKFDAGRFDLLVCDMSWSHRQMAKLVLQLADAVQSGGTAIITVKLMHKKAFQSIREVTEDLAGAFTLQKAKQLFHNRDELTLFFLKA